MSETHYDEYEHYNFDHDKHIFSSHSGKQRSKKEATEHTNHFDPSGHSRKILTKLMNTNHNNNKKACKNCCQVNQVLIEESIQQKERKVKCERKSKRI
ncbi:nuclear protein 1-like [Drosophila tropicalis]